MGKTTVNASGYRKRSGTTPAGNKYSATKYGPGVKRTEIQLKNGKTVEKDTDKGLDFKTKTTTKRGELPNGRDYKTSRSNDGSKLTQIINPSMRTMYEKDTGYKGYKPLKSKVDLHSGSRDRNIKKVPKLKGRK